MDDQETIQELIESGFYNQDLLKYCTRFEVLSLQKACLKIVINNLPRFNYAFHSTKDRKLRRNLQFLRKKFSAQILQEVLEEGSLNEKYLNFLVNEFLEEIKVGVLSRFNEETILKRMADIGYGFKKVYIDVLFYMELDRLVPFINSFISHLPNVEKLLIHSRCDDDTIKVISSTCKNLKELYINGICTVSDEGVKHLKALSGTLQILSLKYTDIEEDGIPFLLENLPLLEVLTYHQLPNVLYRMHRPDLLKGTLSQLKKYNLTSLDLCHKLLEAVPNVHDILTICSELCPRLKELSTLISSEKHLEIVSLFPCLESLSIHGTRKEPVDLNAFLKSNGRQLKELKIDCFAFSPGVLVENCPNLKSLRIGKNSYQTEDQNDGVGCYYMLNMRHFALDKLNFRDEESESCFNIVLDASPNLETLVMRDCELEDSRVGQKLSLYLPSSILHSVTFRYTDTDISLLQALLLECVFLKKLILKYCGSIKPCQVKWLYENLKMKRKYVDIQYDDDYNLSFLSSGSSDDF